MNELKIGSDLAEIEKIKDFLKESLKGWSISEQAFYIIELSIAEICINIVRYAYPHKKGKIFLKTWRQERKLFIEIRDNGVPFDPRETKSPDIREIIKGKKRGGLGIFLARELMNGFDYRRENNQNILTMSKKIEEAAAPESV